MIEVEKKFLLTPIQQQSLLLDARKLGERSFKDSYFDTSDYRLTTNDLWFRKRNETYELKAPLSLKGDTSTTVSKFQEITAVEEIRRKLSLEETGDFEFALSDAGIKPFMTCFTHRKSYEKQGLRVDIDSATYFHSDFTHTVAEIELLVDDESEINEAENRIIKFARSFNLVTNRFILGKVAAYLKQEIPGHYETLVKAGILE